ncbi:hypothetical protein D9M71_807530 [compost metagenome]
MPPVVIALLNVVELNARLPVFSSVITPSCDSTANGPPAPGAVNTPRISEINWRGIESPVNAAWTVSLPSAPAVALDRELMVFIRVL